MRVGFAVGHTGLIEALNLVKNCFNSYPLGRLALTGAEVAFRDKEYFEKTRQQIMRSRDLLVKELVSLGFYAVPSKANFLFVKHASWAAEEILQQLRQRRIVVRHFSQPRIVDFLRISIGRPDECAELVRVLREILG